MKNLFENLKENKKNILLGICIGLAYFVIMMLLFGCEFPENLPETAETEDDLVVEDACVVVVKEDGILFGCRL